MFLLWLKQLPQCGDQTPATVLPPTEGRSSATNTPVFPPRSFILLSFAWFYIFFSAGQVLLSILSWFVLRSSVSEGVFLMYAWREMYSTSTCSVIILFPPLMNFYIEGEKIKMKLKIWVKKRQLLLSDLMGYIGVSVICTVYLLLIYVCGQTLCPQCALNWSWCSMKLLTFKRRTLSLALSVRPTPGCLLLPFSCEIKYGS